MHASLVSPTLLRCNRIATKECIHGGGHIFMDKDVITINDLHHHIKGWRRLSLQDTLLRPSTPRLVVPERHALDPTDQVGERWVQHQVVKVVAVRRADQLHAALSNGARSNGLRLRTNLVNDDHLWHVVLHRLNHHQVLTLRSAHLHATRLADRRVRNIAVARDLI